MNSTNSHILEFLEEWAPQSTKLEYDNVGLLLGDKNQKPHHVLVTLDVTDQIVDEAIRNKVKLIVAHHPLIFQKLSRITVSDPVGSLIYRLIQHDISLIAAHTNLDAAYGGVSFVLAEKLGLEKIHFLSENPEQPPVDGSDSFPKSGFGAVGILEKPLGANAFLDHVIQSLGCEGIRYSGSPNSVKTVAVCGGAGVFLVNEAMKHKADAFVTADIKYHDFFYGSTSLLLVDAGHYESEVPVVRTLCDRLSSRFPDLHFMPSEVCTNPVKFVMKQSN